MKDTPIALNERGSLDEMQIATSFGVSRMKTLIALLAILTLAGCATSGDYKQYVAAQQEANKLAAEGQKPLVRLTAQPGQAIAGLASLEVYTPTAAPVIQQARPNEWVGVFGQGLSILGTVASLKVSGDAAIGLADSVGKWSSVGYSSAQAPAANISTVTTNTTTDASNRSTTTGATITRTDASNRSTATGAVSTTTDASNRSTTTGAVSTVGDNSGSNSGNSGRIAGTTMSDSTSTPTVVTQPAPVVVTQPAPVVVTQPAAVP